MTNQEAFNIMAVHLLTQMKKSVSLDDEEACLYRGPGGLKCAVGCLIPDEEYDSNMEGVTAAYLLKGKVPGDPMTWVPPKALKGVSVQLLADMQSVHDNKPVDDWRYRLNQAAERHDLTMPEIPTQTESTQ